MVVNPPVQKIDNLEEERDRRLRHRICFLLDSGSLCLFALFLIHLLPVLVESNPMQPEWQGQFVETVERQGIFAFLGFVLLHLASFLNPKKQRLRQRLRLVRHLAVIATAGFLLLIPLQLASSLQSFRTLQIKQDDQAAQVTKLMQIRESILRAENSKDLHLRLLAFSEPGLSEAQKAKDFQDLRKDLLAENDDRQFLLTKSIKEQTSYYSPLTLLISRVLSLLAWATAFAAGAVPYGSKKALLERNHRRSTDQA
ncbi:MAG: hypothetical protein VKO39_00860 [Cyanobacteriota bacterium]|nr:hypothetical protein [Cyanobacteriota bacterium]